MSKVWRRRKFPRVARKPSEPMAAVRRLMNWDPFLDLNVAKLAREAEPVFAPAFDILETAEYYAFLADLPGVRQEDLEVAWAGGQITIAGVREPESLGEGGDYYALERTFGRFSRSFRLPAGVCADKTSAMLKDGVLTVLVPKEQAGGMGRIPILDRLPSLDRV